MLYNVQVLRAVAALLVVHAHAAGVTGLGLSWEGGATGVDLFFVISGFIIAYVGSIDTDQFMMRRLIRIVPIYWSSTIAIFLLVLLMPQMFRTTSADGELLVRSLLFVPGGEVHSSDGLPHPTIAGGWTLNFEMYFYALFALALMWSRDKATWIAIGLLLAVMAAVYVTGIGETSPVAYFYGYPIVLEFIYGIFAFHIVRIAERRGWKGISPRLQQAVLILFVIAGLTCLAFTEELFGTYSPRWFLCGIPAFAVVVSAVLLERLHGLRITNRYAVMVGDASYVLYLIHGYAVFGILRLVVPKRVYGELEGQIIVIGLIGMSTLIAIAVYRLYEQPILRFLKARLLKPSARQRAQAAAPAASAH